jgi:hypothetical protein
VQRITARDIERYYFEQLRRDFAIPAGDVIYADRPDVRIQGQRTIGVEVARLYIVDGADPASEQVQRARREQVLMEAQEIHRQRGGRRIELHVDFNPNRPILDITRAAKNLAAVAFEVQDRSQTVLWNPPAEADLFRYAYHNGEEYADSKWRNAQSFSVPTLDVERLLAVVAEKAAKVSKYDRCDEYWLLLVVDFMDSAQDQELALPAGFRLPPSVFSKVLTYKPQFRQVLEVPQ